MLTKEMQEKISNLGITEKRIIQEFEEAVTAITLDKFSQANINRYIETKAMLMYFIADILD